MPVKDFDLLRNQRIGSVEDRTFTIVGQSFVARASVKPETLTRYENMSSSDPSQSTMNTIDELILAMVEPGDGEWVYDPRYADEERAGTEEPPKVGPDHARYLELRKVEEGNDVLSIGDLRDITEWLVERQTGRPTGQRSDSSRGRATTGAGSTERSSLRAVSE
jgi:hypothetical protein